MIQYRTFVRQWLLRLLPACFLVFIFVCIMEAFDPTAFSGQEVKSVGALLVSGSFLMLIIGTRQVVVLTPDGVLVTGPRRGMVKWPDVRAITVEKLIADRTVVLTLVDGKRIRLPAPVDFLDSHFDEKVKVIRACWRGQYDFPVKSAVGAPP